MNKLLALLALAIPLLAQGTPAAPDCPLQQGTFNAAGDLQFDNRNTGCDNFTVYYIADSTLTFTLVFQSQNAQSAPSSTGWATYTGNTSNSSASFGTAAAGIATYCGLATCVPSAGVTVETSWVRAHLSGISGAGQVRVFFYGYRTGNATGLQGSGGGGGGSGCPNPCPVEGTAAAGAPPVGPPVLGAGSDGTDVRTIATDASGNQKIIGNAAVGAAASNPVPTGSRDDSNNVLADHSFPIQGTVTGSSVTAIKMIAGVSAKLTYVGSVSFLMNTGTTYQFVQGTTVSTPCDTGQAAISGTYQTSTGIALDFTPYAALHTTVNANDLCVLFGASVTVGGLVEYSQR